MDRKTLSKYRCFYCTSPTYKTDEYSEIVEHCVKGHKCQTLKYRELILQSETGLLKYQSKSHEGIIPIRLENEGKTIEVRGSQTFITRTTPKRKKLNTPVKDKLASCRYLPFECEDDELPDEVDIMVSSSVKNSHKELLCILPSVLEGLEKDGHMESFLKYTRLLSEGRLPTNNICYLLFLDLVEWFSCDQTSSMRYRPETVKFWQIGYRLFHGKFLRFMSGPKHTGTSALSEKGRCYDPSTSQINFPVPSKPNLYGHDKIKPILPGICIDAIKAVGQVCNNRPMKLAVDGKKICRGKGKIGDVDCWGFEAKPSLQDRKDKNRLDIEVVDKAKSNLNILEEKGLCSLKTIPASTREELLKSVKDTIQNIAFRNHSLRDTNTSLLRSEKKFMEFAGEKWRESKLYPVICSIRVQKSEIKKHIQDGLALTDDLCCNGATINKMENTFCKSTSVVMDEQPNYNALVENFPTNDTRFVQQKTEKWFDIRKEAKVTGSTCNSALGLGKLKQQRKHFDQVMKGVEINEEDTRAISQRLIYGNEHEIDAIATLTSKVLPLYYPDLKYFEEGCMRIPSTSSESFMVVSPDGSLRQSKDELPEFMYENKCKAPDSYDPTSYYSIPNYYVVQLLSEMNAYNCQKLIFTCWSEQSMTTFLVQNDRELWSKCWEELVNVYGSKETKAPTKFSLVAKELKDDIRVFTQSHVTLIGEFRPCCAIKLSNTECIEEGAYKKGARSRNNGRKVTGIDELRDCLQCVRKWFEEAYELLRVVASEILVFMVNDLDRIYHSDLNNAHPIAYALKGPSMSTEVLRNMTEEVIKTCEENGVEIVATASDGQWHQYGVRDNWKQPLTLHQLHRDHWSSVTSRDKSKLLTEIKNLYCFNSLEDILYVKRMGCIDVSGHGQDTPIGMKSISVSNVGVCDNDSTNCSDEGKDDSYSSYCGYEGCLGGSFVDDVDEETLRNVDEVISETLSSKQEHNKIDMCQIDQSCEFDIGQTCLYNNSNYEYQYTENPNGHQDHDTTISLLEQAHSVLFDDTHYWDSLGYDYILNDVSESTIEDNYVPIAPMEVQSMEFIEETTNFEIDDNICITNSCIGDALTVRYETETGKIDDSVLRQLLDALCKDDVAMKKHDWSSIELVEFSRRFASKDEMKKYFLRHELFIMANYLECRLTSQGASVRRSWPKDKLNDYLHQLIMTGITPLPSISSKSKKRHILSLKKMAYRAVSKMPKIYLGIKMAEYTWAKTASEWRCKNKIPSEICFEDTNECVDWFTQPSIGEDGNIRFHFTDACHILTCLRTKICTTGISGLRKEAWEMAALSKDTMLNVSIVLDCIDKQDVALARRMFDKDVEECMERNGSFFSEAEFCRLIRNWFDAEDEPSIPALTRCHHRLKLRHWLLSGYPVGHFPPPTQYVRGIPIVTYEGLLAHVERKLQLHALVPEYNARATGSQEVEQFFSTFRDMDPAGNGTPKPDSIPGMMAAVVEIDSFRLDPNKPFYIKTSRAAVYPSVICMAATDTASNHTKSNFSRKYEDVSSLRYIKPRDHAFDHPNRDSRKKRRKKGLISKPGQPAHGEKGVRQYHSRDDSKIPAHRRLGLKDLPE